jgi:hypothetical protein
VALNPSTVSKEISMKTIIRAVAIMAVISVIGCRSYEGLWDKSQVRNVALQHVGLEQIAWNAHDKSALPSGMESLVSLTRMTAHVDSVNVEGTAASVVTSYRYDGTFSTPEGEKTGTLRVQRRLQFTKNSDGKWVQSAPPVEIARNSSWKAAA